MNAFLLKWLFASITPVLTLGLASMPPDLIKSSPSPSPSPVSAENNISSISQAFIDLEVQVAELKAQTQFTRILKRGLAGGDVENLQENLNKFDPSFTQDYITGHFGSHTEKALKRFQAKNRIPVTGMFDEQSRFALARVIASASFTDNPVEAPDFSGILDQLSPGEDTASQSSNTSDNLPEPSPKDMLSKNISSQCLNAGYILPNDIDSLCSSNGYISTEDASSICMASGYVPAPAPIPTSTPSPSSTPKPSLTLTPKPTASPTPTLAVSKTPTPKPTPKPSR